MEGAGMTASLGDRMKAYERRETGRTFLPMLPVYARIDGRTFSRFTEGMERPFDPDFVEAMVRTTEALVEHSHARIGYAQSDEISLLWLADDAKSEIFFKGKIQKMASVLAAYATAAFTRALLDGPLAEFASRLPHFDARVFQLPSQSEAANVMLWRELDATKNAVSMAARHHYSHDELDGRTSGELQELLFRKGVNFNDYPAAFKRGTFVRREGTLRELSQDELSGIAPEHRPAPGHRVRRSSIERLDMPRFASVVNREAVLFDGAAPEVAAGISDPAPVDSASAAEPG
jgi:tRNA(His) 5'-end guanylyltransferase